MILVFLQGLLFGCICSAQELREIEPPINMINGSTSVTPANITPIVTTLTTTRSSPANESSVSTFPSVISTKVTPIQQERSTSDPKIEQQGSSTVSSTIISKPSITTVNYSKSPSYPPLWDVANPDGDLPDWVKDIIGTSPIVPPDGENAITQKPCKSSSHPSPPPGFNPDTDLGTGYACMKNFYNYFPCGTYEEYVCMCMDSCTTEENTNLEEMFKTNQTMDLGFRNKISDGFQIAILSIVMLVGLFGNILVIVTIAAFMGKQTVTNMYICNLAVADLLVILICIPFKLVDTINQFEWSAGDAACRIVSWFYFFSFMSSIFTLTAMSIERFLVICYPVNSHVITSTRRTGFIIAIVWITGAILACPTFYIFTAHRYGPHTVCGVDDWSDGYGQRLGFYLYIFLVIFLLPCVIMGFAYIRTCMSLWESIKKQRELKNTHIKHSSLKDDCVRKERKPPKSTSSGRFQVIRVLILVLVVFCVCWFPYLFTQVIVFSKKQQGAYAVYDNYEREFSRWFNVLSLANSCFNPILYGLLSRRYREGFIRCFKCDRNSLNKVNSSVRTASSSIGRGSLQKQSSTYSRQSSVKSTNSTYSRQSSVKSNDFLHPLPEVSETEESIANDHNTKANTVAPLSNGSVKSKQPLDIEEKFSSISNELESSTDDSICIKGVSSVEIDLPQDDEKDSAIDNNSSVSSGLDNVAFNGNEDFSNDTNTIINTSNQNEINGNLPTVKNNNQDLNVSDILLDEKKNSSKSILPNIYENRIVVVGNESEA